MKLNLRKAARISIPLAAVFCALLIVPNFAAAQSGSMLLVLEKSDNSLAFVDPSNLQIVARVPSGPDPHEIVTSPDGKLAYISNYGGLDSALNTISVVDLAARKALPPINLGALRSAHGLTFAGGKLYFTVETNKAIGRFDPATQSIDWLLGTGQDRTHMVELSKDLNLIVTSNVSSGTLSLIEQITPSAPAFGPPPSANPAAGAPPPGATPPGGPRKTWRVTNVPAGHGAEGFDISPDGKQIWAANAQDATVTIIDVASKSVSQTVPISVRGANRLKFMPDGKRVLISGLGGGSDTNLVVMDASTHQEVRKFSLGGGSAGILVLPDGSRAFIAVSAKDKVASLDLKSLEITGYIATGKQPDGLAWAQAH